MRRRGELEKALGRSEEGFHPRRTTRNPIICFPSVRPVDAQLAVKYTTRRTHSNSSFNQWGGTEIEIDVEKKRSHAMLTMITPTM